MNNFDQCMVDLISFQSNLDQFQLISINLNEFWLISTISSHSDVPNFSQFWSILSNFGRILMGGMTSAHQLSLPVLILL